jgi:hypothetical protein
MHVIEMIFYLINQCDTVPVSNDRQSFIFKFLHITSHHSCLCLPLLLHDYQYERSKAKKSEEDKDYVQAFTLQSTLPYSYSTSKQARKTESKQIIYLSYLPTLHSTALHCTPLTRKS